MPAPIPLDTPLHAHVALLRLNRIRREDWPRVLGAAAGFGLISPGRARELLGLEPLPGDVRCPHCGCFTQITCPDCGADACARCWACMTDNCGPEDPDASNATPGDLGLLAR